MKILTFDIGGTDIKYGVCDENFCFTEKNKTPTNAMEGGPALIEKVCNIAKDYTDVDCIGISTAGQVNSITGEIVYATDNIPHYTGVKVKELVEKATDKPVKVENDVNSAAIGEYVMGAAKGCDNFLCLTYGTGIGGAIIIDGKVFTGSSFSAGEMGHIITHTNGRKCTCGGKGCYECYASAKALTNDVYEKTGEKLNGIEIFESKNFARPEIKEAVDNWINEVATGLISIIYIFNPSCIVVGGGIMNEKYITDKLNEALQNNLMASFRNVKVLKAETGNNAGMIGAAYLAMKNIENR